MRIPRRRIRSFDPSGTDHLTINEHINDVVNALQALRFGSGAASGAENIECDFATVTFAAAGVEVTASHGLKRVPTGVWLIKADRPGNIYNSAEATSASVYLKADSDTLSGVIVIV